LRQAVSRLCFEIIPSECIEFYPTPFYALSNRGNPSISSVWHTRATRDTSELDEVGGTIGRAGQFAKRDGGLRSPRFPEKEKETQKRKSLVRKIRKAPLKRKVPAATPRYLLGLIASTRPVTPFIG
jgi:hypothetical protein